MPPLTLNYMRVKILHTFFNKTENMFIYMYINLRLQVFLSLLPNQYASAIQNVTWVACVGAVTQSWLFPRFIPSNKTIVLLHNELVYAFIIACKIFIST